jgi:predicted NBD/HSP70 family sugar kinase
VFVADLGATSTNVAFADLGGPILAHRSDEAEPVADAEPIVGLTEALFDELAASAETTRVLVGIGVNLPGPG